MEQFTTSLIITTYKRADALSLVLSSLLKQTQLPDEVLVADDGSGMPTQSLLANFAKNSPIPFQHIWQEDVGFRLAQIRNKAIAASSSDYLIVIDGDMILHPSFIQTHLQNAQKKYFIQGSRVLLSEDLTHQCIQTQKIDFSPFQSGITNRINAINNSFLSKILSKEKNTHVGVRGCNMAFWKEDVYGINGFNEDFQGWGREDSEFVVRLLNSGVQRKNIKCAAVAYHLYHPENPTASSLNKNDQLLQKAIEAKSVWCEKGVSQYNGE